MNASQAVRVLAAASQLQADLPQPPAPTVAPTPPTQIAGPKGGDQHKGHGGDGNGNDNGQGNGNGHGHGGGD
jgi:hypothetical protein